MRLDGYPAAFAFTVGEIRMMLALNGKAIRCEICGRSSVNPATSGIESDEDAVVITVCHSCGPIDLEVMELCRESTVGCSAN